MNIGMERKKIEIKRNLIKPKRIWPMATAWWNIHIYIYKRFSNIFSHMNDYARNTFTVNAAKFDNMRSKAHLCANSIISLLYTFCFLFFAIDISKFVISNFIWKAKQIWQHRQRTEVTFITKTIAHSFLVLCLALCTHSFTRDWMIKSLFSISSKRGILNILTTCHTKCILYPNHGFVFMSLSFWLCVSPQRIFITYTQKCIRVNLIS